MAERGGFEPPVEFPPHVISSHAESAGLSHLSAAGTRWVPRSLCCLKTGGEGGIRTHDTRKGIPVFETGRFNHLRTSPQRSHSETL